MIMEELLNKIDKLLELVKDQEKMEFTDEIKALISEIAEEGRKSKFYEKTKDKLGELTKDDPADVIYLIMTMKMIQAPTFIHMIASALVYIPFVDDKIKSGKEK